MSHFEMSDANKKPIKGLSCERQLQLSRKSKDGHCKMAVLKALLFDRLIFIFLCILTCIQRTKSSSNNIVVKAYLNDFLRDTAPNTTEVERPDLWITI